MAIKKGDVTSVQMNFKAIEVLSYILLAFVYIMFACKILKKKITNEELHRRLSHVIYINMALVVVFFMYVRSAKMSIAMAGSAQMSSSMLDMAFRQTEAISYILSGFNLLTTGLIVFSGVKKPGYYQ
jgi:hypothetical protein